MKPVFVDRLAVDFVVTERRMLALTPAEKRMAVYRLREQGLSSEKVGEILGVSERTVDRILTKPLPPLLDVNEDGEVVTEDGEVVRMVTDIDPDAPLCSRGDGKVAVSRGLCSMHYRRALRGMDMDAEPVYVGANKSRQSVSNSC